MKKHGFTLIELLVVIAVIAILLAVAMPSLMAAKEQARSVYCRSNIKQLCIAAASYTVENDEYYPIARYTMQVSREQAVASSPSGSIYRVVPFGDPLPSTETVIYNFSWDFTTIQSSSGTQTIPGTLWQGDTIEKVQQCPSYKGGANWNEDPYTGYNYNTSYIGHGQGEWVSSEYTGKVVPHPVWPDSYSIVMSAKVTEVRSPNQCVLFGDGHYAGGANKFMRAPQVWAGDKFSSLKTAGTQGFRHRGTTNVAFGDGHAETRKDIFTQINGSRNQQLEQYNQVNKVKIGFLSSDNSLYDVQ